ncbi:hypothetical protein AB0M50_00135 [Nonomuraea fuscirosea]|uniref:hypothetical protein n=1 Tax=Nonomuraea fuscirosea TaxID=1291556 RepID=UPI003425D3ED
MPGVDDFALKRRHRDATILTDAETSERIDVLPGRHTGSAASSTNTHMPLDVHGPSFGRRRSPDQAASSFTPPLRRPGDGGLSLPFGQTALSMAHWQQSYRPPDQGRSMREPIAALWQTLEETSVRNLTEQQAESFVDTAYAITEALTSRALADGAG